MNNKKKIGLFVMILCFFSCVGLLYKMSTIKPPEIDLDIIDNNITNFDYNIPIETKTEFIKENQICDEYKDQLKLLNSFADNALRSFKENKKCGFIYNSVLSDLENQDIKVYAVVIEDPSISHIIPVIQLENNTYYGYDHQFNAIYTTIVRGNVRYNIYENVKGYYLNDGSFQITGWKLKEKDARVYIKLTEFIDLYQYKDKEINWLFNNLVDQYALKYVKNINLCDMYGGN